MLRQVIEVVRRDSVPTFHGLHEHSFGVHEPQIGILGNSSQARSLFAGGIL